MQIYVHLHRAAFVAIGGPRSLDVRLDFEEDGDESVNYLSSLLSLSAHGFCVSRLSLTNLPEGFTLAQGGKADPLLSTYLPELLTIDAARAEADGHAPIAASHPAEEGDDRIPIIRPTSCLPCDFTRILAAFRSSIVNLIADECWILPSFVPVV